MIRLSTPRRPSCRAAACSPFLTLALALVASSAWAGSPTAERTTRRNEFGGTGNAGYFAWTQDEAGNPNAFHVWVKPTGMPAFQVTQAGDGFSGQVDQTGSLLSYDFARRGDFGVKLYDMMTQTQVAAPLGVNTTHDEFFGAVFGNQLIFARARRTATTLYLVTDRTTGTRSP